MIDVAFYVVFSAWLEAKGYVDRVVDLHVAYPLMRNSERGEYVGRWSDEDTVERERRLLVVLCEWMEEGGVDGLLWEEAAAGHHSELIVRKGGLDKVKVREMVPLSRVMPPDVRRERHAGRKREVVEEEEKEEGEDEGEVAVPLAVRRRL
jgi:hypothetical protein